MRPTTTTQHARVLRRRALWGTTLIALAACFVPFGTASAKGELTCKITPDNVDINAGDSVTFTGRANGGSPPYKASWQFPSGTPSSAKNVASVQVTYDSANASPYTATLTVTDRSKKTRTCTADATVNVQPAGGGNTPPTVTNPGDQTNVEGGSVSLQVQASDDDGDTLGYSATGLPPGLTIDSASGLISGTIAAGAAAGSPYLVTVDVSDGTDTSSVSFQWTVNTVQPAPDVSINSTSQSCGEADPTGSIACQDNPVPEVPLSGTGGHSIVAINDLGMHCGDLDTRISSILPPFQVLLAQVIQKGEEPQILPPYHGPGSPQNAVEVYYSAVSNPNDPILGNPDAFTGLTANGDSYKTNFWDYPLVAGSYDAFYPAFDPFNPAQTLTPLAGPPFTVTADESLPVPNVEHLYIGPDGLVNSNDEFLAAVQQNMPGIGDPHVVNDEQLVHEHLGDKPFFVNFPFGYVANDVNWFEGAGIPFAAYDDFGRENAYPLVRVRAKSPGGNVLASVDTVLPISGEASCKNCHAAPGELVSGTRTTVPAATLEAAGLDVASQIDDPESGLLPVDVSVEYATDINVLRLHDLKHGAKYVEIGCSSEIPGSCDATPCDITNGVNGDATCLTNLAFEQNKPVVCQVCHYTPALDLAQLGPLAGEAGTVANGRNQNAHPSNSRVMHDHHGKLDANGRSPGEPGYDAGNLMFRPMPAPQQDTDPDSATFGEILNQDERVTVLEETCYQCHPGTSIQCLRGAMFNGGMLCNDCHGGMEQVGADFTADVSPTNPGPASFDLFSGNFYEPGSAQPRVPWANEPGCGSCHTGDAKDNLAGAQNVIANAADINGNTDDIRLRQAWYTDDTKATPIVPTNTRFAENPIPTSFNGFTNPGAGSISSGADNPKLYRVSTGHGGVFCEGCHGATHAEWPNGNPMANDNVTADQLQGHTGTIIECSTCHADGLANYTGLEGPHGMHVVGDTNFSDGGHENVADNNAACFECHGGTDRNNSQGTVLSRAATDRTLSNEGGIVTVAKGDPVGCVLCHGQEGGD
ncbi:MAG: putative Ig domain-containing protein [Pseudomonadota bacterium]|nr:putative Ig domain-containing protein [Pseudomonadota bacterium]